MQRLLFWLRLFVYSLAACGFNTHAGSLGDLRTSYGADFGQVLVGSAIIRPNSIQWAGTEAAISVAMTGNSAEFGLTGELTYVETAGRGLINRWVMESPQSATLMAPQSGAAPNVGYFFAPYRTGLQTNTDRYNLSYSSSETLLKDVSVQGTGVADDMVNPSMTVDVTIQGGVEGANCEKVQNCKYVDVLPSGEVVFTVTPQSKKSGVQYAYVVTRIQEVNNSCTSSDTSFKTIGVTQVSLDANDYYQIVDGIGPNVIRKNCVSSDMPVLRSIGKSFQFRTSNVRDTKTNGYAQYEIFLNGHQDIDDLTNSKWPGSHQIYRLRTTPTTTTPSSGAAKPILATDKTSLTFHNTQLTSAIILSNSGTGTLSVSQISLDGPDKADFRITGCENAKLAAAQTCTLVVTLKVPVDPSRLRSARISINSDGGNKIIQLNSDYPALTAPVAFDKDGNSVRVTNAVMMGGLSVNNQAFVNGGNLNLADTALITARITPADEHVGNTSSMFVMAGYVPNGTYADCKNKDKSTFYYLLSRSGNTYCQAPRKLGTEAACQGQALYPTATTTAGVWDGSLSTLGTLDDAQNILLSKTPIELKMWEGNFEAAGTLCVWFGYRLSNGTLLISGESLNLTVKP